MFVKIVNKKRVVNRIAAYRLGNKREWKAITNTLASMFSKLISLLALYFYVRWTLPYLGKEMFGVWMTMTSVITFLSIFSDLGLGNSLINHIAASKARNAQEELKEYTSSSFFFLALISTVIGIIFFFSSSAVLRTITNGLMSEQDIDQVKYALIWLFTIFLINLPFVTVDKTLEGHQLSYVSSNWSTVGNIISLIVTYFITQQSLGISWLIASTFGLQSLIRIIYFFVEFNSRLVFGRPSFKYIRLKKASSLLRSGLLFFLLNIFNVLAFQLDNILISKELGVGNVALFSLMQKLMSISMFFWFYTISLWPAFAEAHSIGDKTWINKTAKFVIKLNTLIGVLYALFMILFSGSILKFWSNGLVATPSFTLTLGFGLYIILNGVIGGASLVFNTGPLLKKHIAGFCLASFTTILLKYLFIKKLGVDYLMYMGLLPFIFFYLLPCFIQFKKYLKA
jgi:O-antigen/teichoic acid export membrane protein